MQVDYNYEVVTGNSMRLSVSLVLTTIVHEKCIWKTRQLFSVSFNNGKNGIRESGNSELVDEELQVTGCTLPTCQPGN